MASIRDLKKDIDYLTYEVLADCFAYLEVNPKGKKDEIISIVNDTVDLRNGLIVRVNNPEGKDNPRILKTHFQTVRKDLFVGVDKLFSRLSAVSGK